MEEALIDAVAFAKRQTGLPDHMLIPEEDFRKILASDGWSEERIEAFMDSLDDDDD